MSGGRHPWWLPLAGVLGAWLIRLWGRTWRMEVVRGGGDFEEPAIFAFWHARLLPLTYAHRRRHSAVLISRHTDGELIARIIERLGFATARGSSTRGGEQAMIELIARAGEGRSIGVTPDGPRGPARVVKPGVVYLASRTGLPVVAVSAGAARSRTLRSWDGFRVPMPFTRMVIAYGTPLRVPPTLSDAERADWCVRIGTAIDETTALADARAGAAP